jgi:hypothetical protein
MSEPTPSAEAPTETEIAADDPDVVRAQIAETRQALGDTVDALVAKADVKARVSAKVDERKAQLHDQSERVVAQVRDKPAPVAAIAALIAVVAALLLMRRAWR